MDCKEAEELLPAYALNALSVQEMVLVEAHLETCTWCAPLYWEHVQVAAVLAQSVEPLQPPHGLKSRILKAVEEQDRQRHRPERPIFTPGRLVRGAVGSIAILLLVAVTVIGIRTSLQIEDLQQENVDLAGGVFQNALYDEKLMDMAMEQRFVSYIMASADKRVSYLQAGETVPRAQGMLIIASQGGTGILMANGLEPSSQANDYHVWLTKDGQRLGVGRLSVDETGWGVLTLWPAQPITLFEKVWVTEELPQASAGDADRTVLWGNISTR